MQWAGSMPKYGPTLSFKIAQVLFSVAATIPQRHCYTSSDRVSASFRDLEILLAIAID
jgi:hypothetical protein